MIYSTEDYYKMALNLLAESKPISNEEALLLIYVSEFRKELEDAFSELFKKIKSFEEESFVPTFSQYLKV